MAFDGLVECTGLDLVERSQVPVEHDGFAADVVNHAADLYRSGRVDDIGHRLSLPECGFSRVAGVLGRSKYKYAHVSAEIGACEQLPVPVYSPDMLWR